MLSHRFSRLLQSKGFSPKEQMVSVIASTAVRTVTVPAACPSPGRYVLLIPAPHLVLSCSDMSKNQDGEVILMLESLRFESYQSYRDYDLHV